MRCQGLGSGVIRIIRSPWASIIYYKHKLKGEVGMAVHNSIKR